MKKYIGFLFVLVVFLFGVSEVSAYTSRSYVRVVSPNGGEQITLGQTYKIKWKSNISRNAKVYVYLYNDDISCPAGIMGCSSMSWIGATKNTGSFLWNTNNYMSGLSGLNTMPITQGNKYKILIRINNYGVSDKSNNYFEIIDSYESASPVITGISGPQNLSVGNPGTWEVKAYDPNSGNLSYSVDWGEYQNDLAPALSPLSNRLEQSATFTHRYNRAGNYRIKFTVTNEEGESESTSMTVNVISNIYSYN